MTSLVAAPEVAWRGGGVGVDVRTGKKIGEKTLYLRRGTTVEEVSADQIRRIELG